MATVQCSKCTAERKGFRRELDSWRHKLIHCVGFESILEGIYGQMLLRDISLFDDCEPEEVDDWSPSASCSHCSFCNLPQDKFIDRGPVATSPLSSPSDYSPCQAPTISDSSQSAHRFLQAVFHKKDVPLGCDSNIPLVAQELMKKMIHQFALEYASKCLHHTAANGVTTRTSSPLSDTSDAPLDLTVHRHQEEKEHEADGVLDLSNSNTACSVISSSSNKASGSLLPSHAEDLEDLGQQENKCHRRSVLDAVLGSLCPSHSSLLYQILKLARQEKILFRNHRPVAQMESHCCCCGVNSQDNITPNGSLYYPITDCGLHGSTLYLPGDCKANVHHYPLTNCTSEATRASNYCCLQRSRMETYSVLCPKRLHYISCQSLASGCINNVVCSTSSLCTPSRLCPSLTCCNQHDLQSCPCCSNHACVTEVTKTIESVAGDGDPQFPVLKREQSPSPPPLSPIPTGINKKANEKPPSLLDHRQDKEADLMDKDGLENKSQQEADTAAKEGQESRTPSSSCAEQNPSGTLLQDVMSRFSEKLETIRPIEKDPPLFSTTVDTSDEEPLQSPSTRHNFHADAHLTEIITTVLHTRSASDYNLSELFNRHENKGPKSPNTRFRRRQEVLAAMATPPNDASTRRHTLQIKRELALLDQSHGRRKSPPGKRARLKEENVTASKTSLESKSEIGVDFEPVENHRVREVPLNSLTTEHGQNEIKEERQTFIVTGVSQFIKAGAKEKLTANHEKGLTLSDTQVLIPELQNEHSNQDSEADCVQEHEITVTASSPERCSRTCNDGTMSNTPQGHEEDVEAPSGNAAGKRQEQKCQSHHSKEARRSRRNIVPPHRFSSYVTEPKKMFFVACFSENIFKQKTQEEETLASNALDAIAQKPQNYGTPLESSSEIGASSSEHPLEFTLTAPESTHKDSGPSLYDESNSLSTNQVFSLNVVKQDSPKKHSPENGTDASRCHAKPFGWLRSSRKNDFKAISLTPQNMMDTKSVTVDENPHNSQIMYASPIKLMLVSQVNDKEGVKYSLKSAGTGSSAEAEEPFDPCEESSWSGRPMKSKNESIHSAASKVPGNSSPLKFATSPARSARSSPKSASSSPKSASSSSKSASSPHKSASSPSKSVSSSSKSTSSSPKSASSSPKSASSPSKSASSPSKSASSSPKSASSPSKSTSTSSKSTSSPLKSASSPSKSASSSSKSISSSPKSASSPSKSASSSPKSASSPSKSASSSSKSTSSSPKSASSPSKSASSSPKSASSPSKSASSPSKSASSPPKSASSPRKSASSPSKSASSPPKSASSPPKSASSPPKSASSPPKSASSPSKSASSSPKSASSSSKSASSPPKSLSSPRKSSPAKSFSSLKSSSPSSKTSPRRSGEGTPTKHAAGAESQRSPGGLPSLHENTPPKRRPGRPRKLGLQLKQKVKRPIGRPRKQKAVDSVIEANNTKGKSDMLSDVQENVNKNLKITVLYGRSRRNKRTVSEGCDHLQAKFQHSWQTGSLRSDSGILMHNTSSGSVKTSPEGCPEEVNFFSHRKDCAPRIKFQKQDGAVPSRKPGRPAKVKISGISVTVSTMPPQQRKIQINKDTRQHNDALIHKKARSPELKSAKEPLTVGHQSTSKIGRTDERINTRDEIRDKLQNKPMAVRHSMRVRKPSIHFLYAVATAASRSYSHSNALLRRSKQLLLNKASSQRRQMEQQSSAETSGEKRQLCGKDRKNVSQDLSRVAGLSVDSIFSPTETLRWWAASAEKKTLNLELAKRIRRISDTWVSDNVEKQEKERAFSSKLSPRGSWKPKHSSVVRTLFDCSPDKPGSCSMQQLCSWFMQTTETQSLAIVKKASSRNPYEIMHFPRSANKKSVCHSPQAERLRKHVKKFAKIVPKSPLQNRQAQKRLRKRNGASLSSHRIRRRLFASKAVTGKCNRKVQFRRSFGKYQAALFRARTRFQNQRQRESLQKTQRNKKNQKNTTCSNSHVMRLEPECKVILRSAKYRLADCLESRIDTSSVAQTQEPVDVPKEQNICSKAWSPETLKECRVFLRKINSPHNESTEEEWDSCTVTLDDGSPSTYVFASKERGLVEVVKAVKRKESKNMTASKELAGSALKPVQEQSDMSMGRQKRNYKSPGVLSTDPAQPPPAKMLRQSRMRGLTGPRWCDFVFEN